MGSKKPELIRLYFDAKFLNNFLGLPTNSDDELFSKLSFKRFLNENSQIEIHLVEHDMIVTRDEFLRILTGEIVISNLFKDKEIYDYKINPDFQYDLLENPFSFFFVEFNDEIITDLGKKFGLFFCNSNKYFSRWKSVSLNTKYSTTLTIGEDFTWGQMNGFALPTNNIILCAPYITTWDSAKIKSNISNLFRAVTYNDEKIVITIISKSDNFSIQINEVLYTKINIELHKVFKKIELCVIIFDIQSFDKHQNQKLILQKRIHDRNLLTNYFHYDSKAEWDFFRYDYRTGIDQINKNSSIIIKSLLDNSHFKSATDYIEWYREIISWSNNDSYKTFIWVKGDSMKNKLFNNM